MLTATASIKMESDLAQQLGWGFEMACEEHDPMAGYEVGKKYLFFTHCLSNGFCFSTLLAPENAIHIFLALECIEEHVVPIENTKVTTKGFVFKDADGKIFYNQYPVALSESIDDFVEFKVHEADPQNSCYGDMGLLDFWKILWYYHYNNRKYLIQNTPNEEKKHRFNAQVERMISQAKAEFGLKVVIGQFALGNKTDEILHFRPRYTIA